MSANNGDKSRFHRERKAKLARRERLRALRKELSARQSEPSKGASR